MISELLAIIFTKLLEAGDVPREWKRVNIVTLLKKKAEVRT